MERPRAPKNKHMPLKPERPHHSHILPTAPQQQFKCCYPSSPLLEKVGDDGGFILGSGCGVPPNVRPENLRAMIETGKTYEFSQ